MKLRNRCLIGIVGRLGTGLARALSASLRFEYRSSGRVALDPFQPPEREAFVYALWHESFLIPITRFGNPGVAALVSGHADGRLLAHLVRSTGMGVVHGSTNRGGAAALRELLRLGNRHIALTPDGPRGPRRVVQPGIIYLASRAGRRIVPMGVGFRRPWRVSSWDAFVVPRPFSRVCCLFGPPITVPRGLSAWQFPLLAELLGRELNRVTAAAQVWADTGHLPAWPAGGPPQPGLSAAVETAPHPPDRAVVGGVREVGG